jgi:protein SCO1
MNRCFAPLLILASLSGCQPQASAPPPLEGARMGGPFSLVTQDGTRLSDSDLKGQYRLIYFGYSFCPDVCPVDVQKLMAGFRAFENAQPKLAAKTQPIFITVDPARDSPPVLEQFVSAFHPRLIGLTGTAAEIAAVAKAYAVIYETSPGATSGAYLVDHSRTTVLYGPTGEPIAMIAQDGSAEEIAAQLTRWVK